MCCGFKFKFWLGTHKPHHLAEAGVPLFVSHRSLRARKTLPRAIAPWALDSGGFTELNLHGRWTETPEQYVAAIRRYQREIGMLEFAAPQDWMAEGFCTQRTGLDVTAHQILTVQNFLKLRELAPDLPIIPVLQGWWDHDREANEAAGIRHHEGSYEAHIMIYAMHGVDLRKEKLVGLGSVCRKGKVGLGFILNIGRQLQALTDAGVRFHAFGFKAEGLGLLDGLDASLQPFASADSLAWSLDARKNRGMTKGQPMPGCKHGKTGTGKCGNCLIYAKAWRARLAEGLPNLGGFT